MFAKTDLGEFQCRKRRVVVNFWALPESQPVPSREWWRAALPSLLPRRRSRCSEPQNPRSCGSCLIGRGTFYCIAAFDGPSARLVEISGFDSIYVGGSLAATGEEPSRPGHDEHAGTSRVCPEDFQQRRHPGDRRLRQRRRQPTDRLSRNERLRTRRPRRSSV